MTRDLRLRNLTMAFALVGLVDAIYLTFVKLTNQQGLCVKGVGDCWSVNTSVYSEVMGIPVSVFGAGAYLLILILLLLEAKGSFWKENNPILIFGLALAGVLYSAYLTYLEIFVIKAICPFCVFSALVMVVLLALSVTRLSSHQAELYSD